MTREETLAVAICELRNEAQHTIYAKNREESPEFAAFLASEAEKLRQAASVIEAMLRRGATP